MTFRKIIPPNASVVFSMGKGRLCAPSADRNARPIIELLMDIAPERGRALEIASGTGQHIVEAAAARPNLKWQPSDVDNLRIASIAEWIKKSKLDNLISPISLDASEVGWAAEYSNQNFILLINLMHLVSAIEASIIISEISSALTQGGRSLIYGPFRRTGELISARDISFDRDLRKADSELGYKDDQWMLNEFRKSNLTLVKIASMPANNLAFVVEKN